MNLIDELDLCDNGNILSNKYKLLEIGKLLGFEAQTCNEIPNKVCNIADSKMEGRQLMRAKQIFKALSDKIAYLICPDNPTFHEHNNVKGTKVNKSLKENLTNPSFLIWNKTLVTAVRIISK